jgi:hypothetical protein
MKFEMNILIATSPGREDWLRDCTKSFGDIPLTIRSDFSYEIGKLRWAIENTDWARFWLIQDTVVIKNPDFLWNGWSMNSSVALTSHPVPFGMFMGIYSQKILKKLDIPVIRSKEESIKEECNFHNKYLELESVPVLFPDFDDDHATGTEFKHGRLNIKLENDYLIKYKGTWLCGECVGKAISCSHTDHVGSKLN